MNVFDLSIISFFNHFAYLSMFLNKLLFFLADSVLAWVLLISFLWWAWFRGDGQETSNRKHVLSIIISCLAASVILFVFQDSKLSILFRPRPPFNPQSNFHIPSGIEISSNWRTLTSFPSGHAMVFAAISVGILYVSRRAGVLCLIFSLVICLLRIFFGFHYPTDVIAGAVLGVALFYLARTKLVEQLLTCQILRWSSIHPPSFYTAFFIITYVIATRFTGIRYIVHAILSFF